MQDTYNIFEFGQIKNKIATNLSNIIKSSWLTHNLILNNHANAEFTSILILRQRLECLPGKTPHRTSSTTNLNGRLNGGHDYLHTLVPTTNYHRMRLVEIMEGKPSRKRETPLENISSFKGRHDVLSKFFSCTIGVFERTFVSSEYAYQFIKAMSHRKESMSKHIIQARNACEAKRLGKKVITESVWEIKRLEFMKQIIRNLNAFSDIAMN